MLPPELVMDMADITEVSRDLKLLKKLKIIYRHRSAYVYRYLELLEEKRAVHIISKEYRKYLKWKHRPIYPTRMTGCTYFGPIGATGIFGYPSIDMVTLSVSDTFVE